MKQSVKSWLGGAGILALPALAGCGGSSSSTPTAPLPHSVSATLPASGLTATVTEDRTSVQVGGTVTYTLTLANNTAQPITFQPVQRDARPSGGVGDALTVINSTGGEGGFVTFPVFPQGGFAQVITAGPSNTLAPGKSVSGTVLVGPGSPGGISSGGVYTAPSGFPTAGRYFTSVTFTVQLGQEGVLLDDVTAGQLEVDVQ